MIGRRGAACAIIASPPSLRPLPAPPRLQIDGGSGAAAAGAVDSLNVSVATGILLHRLLTAAAAGGAAGPAAGGGGGAAAAGQE